MLCTSMLLSLTACFFKKPNTDIEDIERTDVSEHLIEKSDASYLIHYDEQAPFINDDSSAAFGESGINQSWEKWSLPIGNGYFGVNVFGRTETERVQIADKTLVNPWQAEIPEENWPQTGGLNNFAETYIDIGHTYSKVRDYYRYLDLSTAISGVNYTYDGVEYYREYFTSYPDKALVIRLDASEDGCISFVLRPNVPYEQEYMTSPRDEFGKYGEVKSSVEGGVGHIELTGKMTYYDVDFVGYYRVYTDGGEISATTCKNQYGETDGTITVSGADSAYIVVTLGSDYELDPDTFMTGQHSHDKPTKYTDLDDAKAKVDVYLSSITDAIESRNYEDGYSYLFSRHINDYQNLFGRVSLDLEFSKTDMGLMTDDLLEKYKSGVGSSYLEALLLQYGRYLLISSSREGTLPAHLQGAWNVYNSPAWSSGYWNNVNIQMNYWHAFSTNIAETFISYLDYLDTFIEAAEKNADHVVRTYNKDMFDKDGGNGWTIGTASNPFFISSDRNCGNAGFTTQLYWDYYQFTKDPEVLKRVYDIMLGAARFITKSVKEYDGKYLVEYSDSPEMFVDGVWYYTEGTTYAQSLAYLNNYSVLQLARELGIDLSDEDILAEDDKTILKTVMDQLDKYDPINVGLSGQIKEFREEDYYGSVGYETTHRHISQLVGLFPGNLINADTEAWLDAALVSLNGRIDGLKAWHQASSVGWSWAHKAALFARLGMGDMAQQMILGAAKGATHENLLMICFSVFQIEASCGTSAALTEMLLQSQNGYIEPLPALPSNWHNGSYTGLMARGNFEVSAAWEDGLATSFNVRSNKGERITVKYPSVTGASVYTADGRAVGYDITGQDMISFDTVAGESYVIFGFEKVDTPDKAENFDYRTAAFGSYDLSWDSVKGAESYNLYVAYENDAKYTLIDSVKGNSYSFTVPSGKENVRKTFAITAVNADGREGDRALVYYNPIDTVPTIEGASMRVDSDNRITVDVLANDAAIKYILWEKAKGQSSFAKIGESDSSTVMGDGYRDDSIYAVSVSSVDGHESAKYTVTKDDYVNNILQNKEFIPTDAGKNAIYSSSYDYKNLTDGINYGEYTGRYSSKVGAGGLADATVDLGGSFILDELRIYDYKQDTSFMGTALEIYALSGGDWTKVLSINNSELENYRQTGESGTGWLAFDLNGVWADRIRIHIPACLSNDRSISIYEIECSGALNPELYGRVIENIFKGNSFTPTPEAAGMQYNDGLGYHCLTDGINHREGAGRFSTAYNGYVDATISLNAVYQLKDIRFYVFQKNLVESGSAIQVDTYCDGAWRTVRTIPNSEFHKYIKYDGHIQYIDIDLDYVFAEKIRIYVPSHAGTGYITYYEVECSGKFVRESTVTENVFAGKEFVPTAEAEASILPGWPGGGYESLTDGIRTEDQVGRFTTVLNEGGMMDATLDLDGTYELYNIVFYLYDGWRGPEVLGAGKDLLVQVYYDGEWTDALFLATNEEIGTHLVSPSSAWYDDYLLFNLNGVKAEKVRIYISGSARSEGTTFHEITCSGTKVND